MVSIKGPRHDACAGCCGSGSTGFWGVKSSGKLSFWRLNSVPCLSYRGQIWSWCRLTNFQCFHSPRYWACPLDVLVESTYVVLSILSDKLFWLWKPSHRHCLSWFSFCLAWFSPTFPANEVSWSSCSWAGPHEACASSVFLVTVLSLYFLYNQLMPSHVGLHVWGSALWGPGALHQPLMNFGQDMVLT